jgi:hypothetical protein
MTLRFLQLDIGCMCEFVAPSFLIACHWGQVPERSSEWGKTSLGSQFQSFSPWSIGSVTMNLQ